MTVLVSSPEGIVTPEWVDWFTSVNQIWYPVLGDAGNAIAAEGVLSYPTDILIGPDLVVEQVSNQPLTSQVISNLLDRFD